ncbi:sorting nexin-22 isoform X2 [Gadus chalcogrammus]|uniref:sorting nexin-22 isoform X2 n=1 Tax=Gadus chalcogrammus TaxID=1042646 RepID=UPI0024C47BE5|nr:sorting nexin-22 isoform X2 [Gadus chalcogrammus]
MLVQDNFPMIEVSIPSLEREVDESGKSTKLYRVDVLFNGRKHCVLRRHSEFQVLHRKLRKIVQIPDFPSKRNPHLRTKPVEQRRQELEDYIQDILYQYEDVPQELLDFLLLRHFHTGNKVNSMESLDDLDDKGFRPPGHGGGRGPGRILPPGRPGQLHGLYQRRCGGPLLGRPPGPQSSLKNMLQSC